MGREAIRRGSIFGRGARRPQASSGIRRRFQRLFRPSGQVPHVLLTLSPLSPRGGSVRLACLIHAASVHSEPGSNSPCLKSSTCDLQVLHSQKQLSIGFANSLGGRRPKAPAPHVKLHCSVSKERRPISGVTYKIHRLPANVKPEDGKKRDFFRKAG